MGTHARANLGQRRQVSLGLTMQVRMQVMSIEANRGRSSCVFVRLPKERLHDGLDVER